MRIPMLMRRKRMRKTLRTGMMEMDSACSLSLSLARSFFHSLSLSRRTRAHGQPARQLHQGTPQHVLHKRRFAAAPARRRPFGQPRAHAARHMPKRRVTAAA